MLTQAKPNRRIYNTPCDSVLMEESEGLVIGSLLLKINKILLPYISFVSYSALNAALSVFFEPSNACQHSVRDGMTVVYRAPTLERKERAPTLSSFMMAYKKNLALFSASPKHSIFFTQEE